jgi:hypothetical protein
VFLIGDEVARRAKADERRQRLIWGVGIAMLIGIVASLAASLIVS